MTDKSRIYFRVYLLYKTLTPALYGMWALSTLKEWSHILLPAKIETFIKIKKNLCAFLEHRLNNVSAGHFTVGTVVKLLTGYKNKTVRCTYCRGEGLLKPYSVSSLLILPPTGIGGFYRFRHDQNINLRPVDFYYIPLFALHILH